MNSVVVHHDQLRAFLERLYVAAGVPEEEAAIVARHQVDANLVGHDSHGVIKTADYLRQIASGQVTPGLGLEIEAETPATAVIDGKWGFGFVVTERAMDLAIAKAREIGVAALTVRRQGHVGRLGSYAEQATANGMIAMLMADSGRGPKSVAPFGGSTARLGTNPLCIGIPGENEDIVLDMASSAVAVGKIAVARARGDSLPAGWAITKDGLPARTPADYYDGGALLPLGGDQGHKGFGLSVVIETMCGILTGLGYGVAKDGRHNDGNFIAVFDVARFLGPSEFKKEVSDFVRYLKESPIAKGYSEVFYPGEIEQRNRAMRIIDGVAIDEATLRILAELTEQYGVESLSVAS